MERTPLWFRVSAGVDELGRFWVGLLKRPATYRWLWISALRAG